LAVLHTRQPSSSTNAKDHGSELLLTAAPPDDPVMRRAVATFRRPSSVPEIVNVLQLTLTVTLNSFSLAASSVRNAEIAERSRPFLQVKSSAA
jgi:hypothetical protein